ncbi:EAL domain-containing protein [Arcobacter sp. 15-2]|uniref:EAL domain-containing protein n=1 Tax=Arcobacter sp. 15-2 TaxID=3374109 RepID=UPI00399C9537
MKKFLKRVNLLFYEEPNSDLGDLLVELFADVHCVGSNEDAMGIYQKHYIDIIVIEIDTMIEEKLEFLSVVKNKNLFSLIVAVSKEENLNVISKFIKIGLDSYVKKPFGKEFLIDELNSLEKKYNIYEKYKDDKVNLNLLQQYQNITDKSSIISKTDKSGRITYVNDNFCKISGYTKDELLGKNHNMVRPIDSPKELYKDMWNTIKKKKQQWNGILKNISKNGELYYVKSTITPLLDEDGNIVEYIALRQNISDILTDKKHFLDKIASNIMSVLIMVQIEEFDMLEKFHSLYIIDQIEKLFGYKLLNYLPSTYKFKNVYNLGDGKYALLTDFDSFLEAAVSLEDYLTEFVNNVKKSRLTIDDMDYDINITLSYSLGKHMIYEDAKSGLEMAIEKNITICHANDFSIKDQQEAKKNLDVIKMVKQALDEYKILSYFQPIVNNKTEQIEKYESLVRLIDEKGKVISPYEFLSISKRGSYYNKITKRVLENSFEVLKTIKTELSINLSTLDIEKDETRNLIYSLLEENEKDRKRLVFELLEDERVKDFKSVKIFIRKVKKMGVSIAIDDFGAGYSNFERLLEFEPDLLKIDGSLIKNILTDKYSQNVVETIVVFAKRQNIKTIAEYVENKEIFDFLNNLGVDYSQGYYFGKPEYLAF